MPISWCPVAGKLAVTATPEEAIVKFNGYSKFMTANPVIKIVSYVLYLSTIARTIYAAMPMTSEPPRSYGLRETWDS